MRRTGWGLALAVLCVGSVALAQPAPALPVMPSPAGTLPPLPGPQAAPGGGARTTPLDLPGAASPGSLGGPVSAPPAPTAADFPALPAPLPPVTTLPPAMPPASPPPLALPPAGPMPLAAPPAEPRKEEHAEKAPHAEKEHEEHEKDHEHEHAAHEEEEEHHSAFLADAEFLYWRPVRSNQDYAISGTNPGFGPLGDIKTVDGGYNTGFRVGGGYRFCNGWEASLYYTYFQAAHGTDAGQPGSGALFPTITFPGIVTTVTGASAATSVNLNVYDIEFARDFHPCEELDVRAFVGPRFAYIDEKFAAVYTGGDVTSGTDNVRRQSQYDGFGFRAGGRGDYAFWEHFTLYAKGSASIMTGSYNSSLVEFANGTTIVSTKEKFQKIVPVLDAGMGVSYQLKNLRLSAGYEFVNWFGLDDQINFGDDNTPGKLSRRISDLGFEGFVFRAELVF